MKVRVTDKDKGYAKLLKALTQGKQPVLSVGVFGDAANKTHGDSNVTVGEVAAFHEFGLGVPERSFIRGWVDENQEAAFQRLKQDCEAELKTGSGDFHRALDRLGLFCVGGIQARMSEGIPPPLKTREGTPLIDTGQLRASITYKVDDGT